ncbi:MAG: ABC transporter ATP-binding protein [Candidatus Dojkabacteria bacterium]
MKSILSISNLSKSFARVHAVKDLSFDVYKGDVFAFLGSNGSGKTTTIRCLLDIYQPDEGELLIKGEKYSYKLNEYIGYLPEERGIYTRVKVIDLFVYFATLRGISKSKAKKLSEQYLERVDLIDHKEQKIAKLSSGMQQKAQIGMAILHRPEILILDEPFKGLDPVNRQLFIEIFKELNGAGTTIMYSTHVIDEAQKMANRLIIIDEGEEQVYGTQEEVRRSYGKDNIHIQFAGKFPQESKLFDARIVNQSAEITPAKGVNPQEILNFLVDKNVKLLEFKIDYPGLNEIFIKISKHNHNK